MNIFSNIRKYAGNWTVVDSRNFTEEEQNQVVKAVVTESDTARQEGYGLSVCFTFKGGQMGYIPLSRDSSLGRGDNVDLTTAKILTLERDGETISRIQE